MKDFVREKSMCLVRKKAGTPEYKERTDRGKGEEVC